MAKLSAKRIIWLDLARTLAIYFVVLVHSAGTAVSNSLSFSLLLAPIAATSVPLFVMLSGALLLNKKEGYLFFYKKRLLRLMLPWIIWTIVYVAIKLWQNPVLSFPKILSLFLSTFSSFWFLPMIACLYLITPALRIFLNQAKIKDVLLIIGLWFLAICVLPYYKNSMAFPFYVDDGLVRQTFTYLGYFLLGAVLVKVKLPRLYVLFFGLILGIVWSEINYYWAIVFHQANAVFSFNFIFPGVVFASASLFAILRAFDKKLNTLGTRTQSLIISLGTASFGIYFLHGLVASWIFETFHRAYLIEAGFLNELINSLVLFTISYLIIWGLMKLPYLKRFIT